MRRGAACGRLACLRRVRLCETFAGFDELQLNALAIGAGLIDRRVLPRDDRLGVDSSRRGLAFWNREPATVKYASNRWSAAVTHPIRALVVDDNAAVRDAVTEMLRTFGMKAASAVSGRAALRLCAGECPFDVILADVVMGDIGGVQLAETLRTAYPTVPVILMTGRDSMVNGVIDAGDVPLFKPFGALQLRRVINEALSRHE